MIHEVTLNGNDYQIGKLDAMKQFHLARRIAPIFAALVSGGVSPNGKEDFGNFIRARGMAVAEELAKKTDEEMDHIIFPCLAVVKRKVNNAWTPVKAAGQNALMYDDIDGPLILQLTMEVIQENLASFFPSALPGSESPATAGQ
jgi:hypothetical protein